MPSISGIPFGFCHCGCGEKTIISPRISGDRHLEAILFWECPCGNSVELDGSNSVSPDEYCRLIPLTQGQWTIVCASDYAWLMKWRWQAKWHPNGYYACRSERKDGKVRYISMHRQILGMADDDVRFGDHVNPPATLDNRRSNLRPATYQESVRNRMTPKNNKWICKGLSQGRGGKIGVRVYVNGKAIELSSASSLEEAKRIYHEGIAQAYGRLSK